MEGISHHRLHLHHHYYCQKLKPQEGEGEDTLWAKWGETLRQWDVGGRRRQLEVSVGDNDHGHGGGDGHSYTSEM